MLSDVALTSVKIRARERACDGSDAWADMSPKKAMAAMTAEATVAKR
jgi:hypothetical protein